MKKYLLISLIFCAISSPSFSRDGKVAIVSHRGFWNCESAGFSENSIASLKAAQDNGFWGSEFDIRLTSDDVVIVNHDDTIDGLDVSSTAWSKLSGHLLPNGERRPLLEEYLAQGAKCETTVLVCEFKKQPTTEKEDLLVDKTIQTLKLYDLLKPERVIFISFSLHICKRIASLLPGFTNQYLNGELAPSVLSEFKINGWDYALKVVKNNPSWVTDAHALGMSTNVWTVNEYDDISAMAESGVDAITTNFPLLAREILGGKEDKK